MEKQQLLRDPNIEPTHEVIAEALGMANDAYRKFCETLPDHGIQLEWRYYNDGKAWLAKGQHKWTTVRGTQKEATVLWLSIWDGFFRVAIYVPVKAREDALRLPLEDETKEMIENAKQMGRLKFFPLVFDLDSDERLGAVYTLANFKKMIK